MAILVTGGAGFIGTNFIREWFSTSQEDIINLDKITYAGNFKSLDDIQDKYPVINIKGDIGDRDMVSDILHRYQPRAIIHFAAETHVDKSIEGPSAFIKTNINGTFTLLDTTYQWFQKLSVTDKEKFRFLHISTDEVYGSLAMDAPPFTEDSPFQPNNPYAASKAASDHIVRSYFYTFGLPVITTHCSNNYGPYQFPEKLIPLMIHHAREEKKLPIYGDGLHIRDWVYVTDHCEALRYVLERGQIGETYNIGGNCEKTNLEVVNSLCTILDKICPSSNHKPYSTQISFVPDRMGHDKRYAINTRKIESQLNWHPKHHFTDALEKTVKWFLDRDKIRTIYDR